MNTTVSISSSALVPTVLVHLLGILTRPGKSEAEVGTEARCYEAEARDVA